MAWSSASQVPLNWSVDRDSLEDIVLYNRWKGSNLGSVQQASLELPPVHHPIYPKNLFGCRSSSEMPSGGRDSLHKASRDGELKKIKEIVQNIGKVQTGNGSLKLKLDKKDKDGYTAIHYAVRYGHELVTQYLIEIGADLNVVADKGIQPIHLAARHVKALYRHISSEDSLETILLRDGSHPASILKKLLENGADCNARDSYLQTPLHYAASKGNADAVELLINTKGIKLDAEDKSKATPLHCACSLGSIPVVNLLLLAKADLLKRDDEGLTPFHYAVMSGHLELLKRIIGLCETLSGFINLSALVTDMDYNNQTALHLAVVNGYYSICELLLEKGGRVNDDCQGSMTPLHLASLNGNCNVVSLLLEKHANIEARSSQGDTPLHGASLMNREDVVSMLIEKGASVNAMNENGLTPLMLAVQKDNSKIARSLIEEVGARIDIGDVSEKTAMFLAAEENSVESLRVLLNCPYSPEIINVGDRYDSTPLHVAAMKGYNGIVRMLSEKGAKLDAVDDEGRTALHLSAESGHVSIVRQLLQKKSAMVSDEDDFCNTPLHLASKRGHAMVIDTLIDFGAVVVVRNADLWTPLDCAAANGHVAAALTLLDRGAEVDPIDRAKVTPIHLACQGGYVEMTKLLLEYGANIALLNAEGKNCLDIAVDNGHKDAALAILEHSEWRTAMRHRTPEGGRITTPMRRMIEKLPSVALEVFNKCIKVGKEEGACVVTLYYEFLDDTYANWNMEMEMLENFGDAYTLVQLLIKDGKANTFEKELDKKKNHPLSIMVEHEQEQLLAHPLVRSLLHAKWRSFGRAIYYPKLALYCVFLCFLTSYAIVSTSLIDDAKANATLTSSSLAKNDVKNSILSVSVIIVVLLAGFQLILEVIQVISRKLSYFSSSENLIELIVFIFAIVYVTGYTEKKDYGRFESDSVHISIGSVAIFLAWVNLLLFLRKFPKLGIYFVMFADVLRTFSLFSVTFSLFIIAFGLSYYVLLSKQPPFASPGRSIMKTIVMMIGEFEFDAIFNDGTQPYGVTWLIFGIFVVVMTIILMNLLVGLAVDDIKAVQDQAVLKRMAMQVELVLEVEKFIPRRFRRHNFFQNSIKEVIRIGKPVDWVARLKSHPASLNAIEEAKSQSKDPIDAVKEDTSGIVESVNEMKAEIASMKSLMTELLQNQTLDGV